jgi:hypothetical protein
MIFQCDHRFLTILALSIFVPQPGQYFDVIRLAFPHFGLGQILAHHLIENDLKIFKLREPAIVKIAVINKGFSTPLSKKR